MAEQLLRMRIQFRRDTTENWTKYKDVVPAAGEPCFDTDLHTLKIGDGNTPYGELPTIGGVDVAADGKSLVLDDNTFKLYGFDKAEVGAQPRKNANGELEWVVPSTETLEGLQTTIAGLKTDIKTLQDIVTPTGESSVPLLDRVVAIENALTGTGEGSIDAKINTAFDDFMTKVSDDGTVNTMKELIDYVATHGTEAADMAADITDLQKLIGNTSVNDQIIAAIMADNKKDVALFKHIKYEITNKPAEAQVDYRDKEIRVLCPADTQWAVQAVGENGNPSRYYIGFKAYAPDGAVSFKEDLNTIITDDEMYYFEGNDFAGTDIYGRKYSIVWLPAAKHNDDGSWTYFGANSSVTNFTGWHYSVEWYNADGKVIDTDTIRINLTNENCHNAVEPFYMGSVVKGVKVNGTLLEMVEGKVNIKTTDIVKISDELAFDADGKLGIGQISVSKLVQDTETELVLDGGGAV